MPEPNTLSNLLPRPREIRPLRSDFVLSGRTQIRHTGGETAAVALRLRDLIAAEFGLNLPLVECASPSNTFGISLSDGQVSGGLAEQEPVPDSEEGYCLWVDDTLAFLRARSYRGLLWAAMTFRQLIGRRGEEVKAHGVSVRDWPRYRFRGFMLDSGRSPNSLPKIKRIIRICSAFKLNTLIFREGDDELNAVRYQTNPLGSENPCALTMDDVAEMIGYARERGVAVVPEVESLGHSTAKGLHYPHLVSGGFEHDYGFIKHTRKSHMNPGDPASYALLRSVYEEWLPLLPEPLIHLGLDEVRLPPEDQARHMQGLLALLDDISRANGRQVLPIVWSDGPPTPPEWDHRVIRCLWNYGDGEPNTPENPHLVKQGAPELLGGQGGQPVFMAGGSGSLHTPNSKSDFPGAVANLLSWARWGETARNAAGLLAVQWSGNATDDWLPDFLTAADFGWNVPHSEVVPEQQLSRATSSLSRLKDAASPDPAEVDPPCWDGIWLNGADWGTDILTGRAKR